MSARPLLAGFLIFVGLVAAVPVGAQPMPLTAEGDLGKHAYESSCAQCHGVSGRGDGPLSTYMEKSPVPDLTTLAKKNNGVFPFARVYGIIHGTNPIVAHGIPEVFDPARIIALTEYVSRLQTQ